HPRGARAHGRQPDAGRGAPRHAAPHVRQTTRRLRHRAPPEGAHRGGRGTRALAIAVVLAWAPLAVAQSGGERVRQLVEEGEFERAAAAYAEAMRSSALSREERIWLLEARALLAHAQR